MTPAGTLERAQRVCDEATAGPWATDREYVTAEVPTGRPGGEVIICCYPSVGGPHARQMVPQKEREANAAQVALSRTLLPQLIEVALAALKFREDDHVDTCDTGWGDPCDCIMPDLRTALSKLGGGGG